MAGDTVSQVQRKSMAPVTPVPKWLAGTQKQRKDGTLPASGLQLSRFQAVKKCLPSIKEQVSACTDLQWFGNLLVEKQLIGAQPKDTILHAVGVPNKRKVGQLMESVMAQIKNNPAKYGRFIAILRQEPVLTSLADSIKAEQKTLRRHLTEGQTGRRLSSSAKVGASPVPKGTPVKRRLSLGSGSSTSNSPTGQEEGKCQCLLHQSVHSNLNMRFDFSVLGTVIVNDWRMRN